MSSGNESVRDALRSTLDSKGILSEMKAKMRAGVYDIMNDRSLPTPERPEEVSLACELIIDMMRSFSFDCSSTVFCEESGHSNKFSIGRDRIAEELGLSLVDDDGQVPVLVMIIQLLKSRKLEASMS